MIEPVTGAITLRNLARAAKISANALDGSGHPTGDPVIANENRRGMGDSPSGRIVTPRSGNLELTVER